MLTGGSGRIRLRHRLLRERTGSRQPDRRNHLSHNQNRAEERNGRARGTAVAQHSANRAAHGAKEKTMLETIAVILIILWLLGMVSGYTLGNFIYVLLVIAIVLFLVRLISGRRV